MRYSVTKCEPSWPCVRGMCLPGEWMDLDSSPLQALSPDIALTQHQLTYSTGPVPDMWFIDTVWQFCPPLGSRNAYCRTATWMLVVPNKDFLSGNEGSFPRGRLPPPPQPTPKKSCILPEGYVLPEPGFEPRTCLIQTEILSTWLW